MTPDSELQHAGEQLKLATDYTEVFGIDPNALKDAYRKLARLCHPDRWTAEMDRAIATDSFQRLNRFKNDADQALAAGKYGQPLQLATIRTKHGLHVVKHEFETGDLCTLFETESKHEGGQYTGTLKVARSARDNDLVANEQKALKRMHSVDSELRRHIPEIRDSFIYLAANGAKLRSNVLKWYWGTTLDRLNRVYPALDPVHAAWIWRKLLMTLGHAHDMNVIHGAVIPEHILIEPHTHAVILLDWCYSSVLAPDGKFYPPIPALVPGRRDWYPAEVRVKKSPAPATDLYMAAYSLIWAMGGKDGLWMPPTAGSDPVPRQMRAYFKGCLQEAQKMRPQNAWVLLEEFDLLLKNLGEPFWPRRFVEFAVPAGVA